jgi:hypothetical protein
VTRLRRILLAVCVLAAAWTVVVAVSGGFVIRLDWVRLSSRSPRNSALLAAITGVAAWLLASPRERLRLLRSPIVVAGACSVALRSAPRRASGLAGRMPSSLAPLIAATAAVVAVGTGIVKGAPYVGGADVYGYVSQAHLWTTGTLRVEQPFVRDMKWPFAADAFTPLGYRATPDGTAILPVYSPGLPLLMALFEKIGGRDAVFYVVPLLGGVAVWGVYLMGLGVGGRAAGAAAAVLLATSPTFLFQSMFPMSDVPAAAWWAVSLALAIRVGRGAAVGAGLAAGAAILTRPNLVPLAAVPGMFFAWRWLWSGGVRTPDAARALLFAAGVLAAGLFMAVLNVRLWGSPLASGYGSFDALYDWKNLLPNLNRYPRWLIRTETPVVLLALAAPFILARQSVQPRVPWSPRAVAIAWLCFTGGVLLSYLFHFPNNTWFWLRYILPAFPALLALTGAALVALSGTLADRGIRIIAVSAVVGIVAWHGVAFGVQDGIFGFREGERKSRVVGEFIANHMPREAVFISRLHTGSIRYYSGRLTMHFEGIPPAALDMVLRDLRQLGYHPYIAIETGEDEMFRERFAARSSAGALDWAPVVLLDHPSQIKIYDPAERQAITTVIR